MFFVGGSGPGRSRRPSSRRPSRCPRPRVSTYGARIKQCGPTGGRQAVHQYRTTEMPMKQREPGEHGRPRKSLARERPRPGLELRVPGFHTTAQTPRTPEQRDT